MKSKRILAGVMACGLILSGCTPETRGPGAAQAAVAMPPSGSGEVRSLRAMWKIKEIREACMEYLEDGTLPSTLGPLGFKVNARGGGARFAVRSQSRGLDRIEVLMVPKGTGHICQTTHRTFGGFGSSALAFGFHNALNVAGWTQIKPAPVGNASKVGNGIWQKNGATLVKRVDQRRSGKDSSGDQGYVMTITMQTGRS